VSLKPGQELTHYRIDQKIGEGGMGEVWSATDTRLNRSAAIKALPSAVADDAERLARFKREAQLLAALSHPNIAAIYGLEQIGDTPYLALELVEGEDLSARIEGQPVPVDEALEIALQIAAALEAAHEKGIVHRDLKPGNIKVTTDGKVKVLDFGLAKALSEEDSGSSVGSIDPSTSPTLTGLAGTQAGLILGTVGYMAPEQARGKTVDRRADVWAFGVILYEMLTGERLFKGETVTDVIAALVTREPDWEKLPENTPVAMRRVLKRCLQKDPRKRLRDIGDAALELSEGPEDDRPVSTTSAAAPATSTRRVGLVGAAGIVLGLVLAMTVRSFLTPSTTPDPPIWSSLTPLAEAEYDFTSFLEISPDGRRVAFVATPAGEEASLLWVHDLGEERPRPLSGTEGAYQPFWSPDSLSIAYFAQRRLRRVSIDGGVPQALADAGNAPRGGSWGADGTILFVPDWSEPVYRIPETGGTPEAVTEFNAERLELSHRWPHLLPDGNHFLYFVVSTYPELNPENPSEVDKSGLYIGSLDGAESRLLQTARSRAVYTGGSLLFVDDGILMVRPFDLSTLSFTGEPVSITEKVTQSVDALWGGALFSVSHEGTLLFVRGAPERSTVGQLRWRDREGNEIGTVGEGHSYNNVRISHDGSRVAVSIGDPGDIWVYDLQRDTSTRFTFDPGNDVNPIWSPDDERILFQSSRVIPGQRFTPGNLFQRVSSGLEPEEHLSLLEFGPTLFPTDWSSDGKLVILDGLSPGTGADLMLYSFDDGILQNFLETEDTEQSSRFSPDGRWLAYESDESGRAEVYVRAFPGPGGKWQVSNDGGSLPTWRADGKELFYRDSNGLVSVTVETEGGFRHDTPVHLFDLNVAVTSDNSYTYDATADGRRFLVLEPTEDDEGEEATTTLLQGWRGLLK